MAEAVEDSMLDELQSRLGHKFANENLLREALLQSVQTPVEPGVRSNAHLAWFGDTLVGVFVSESLYSASRNERFALPDGERQGMVNDVYLAEAAKELRLGEHLVNSLGQPLPPYELSPGSLSKAFEAVVAAIYLDSGWESARKFVRRTLKLESA